MARVSKYAVGQKWEREYSGLVLTIVGGKGSDERGGETLLCRCEYTEEAMQGSKCRCERHGTVESLPKKHLRKFFKHVES